MPWVKLFFWRTPKARLASKLEGYSRKQRARTSLGAEYLENNYTTVKLTRRTSHILLTPHCFLNEDFGVKFAEKSGRFSLPPTSDRQDRHVTYQNNRHVITKTVSSVYSPKRDWAPIDPVTVQQPIAICRHTYLGCRSVKHCIRTMN